MRRTQCNVKLCQSISQCSVKSILPHRSWTMPPLTIMRSLSGFSTIQYYRRDKPRRCRSRKTPQSGQTFTMPVIRYLHQAMLTAGKLTITDDRAGRQVECRTEVYAPLQETTGHFQIALKRLFLKSHPQTQRSSMMSATMMDSQNPAECLIASRNKAAVARAPRSMAAAELPEISRPSKTPETFEWLSEMHRGFFL